MLIPKAICHTEIEIKKSRFIASAFPVESTEELKQLLIAVRKEHPQANHVVHASILGKQGNIYGMSDDHEPKNTAGRPILEVLKGSGITNIAVTVVRYFGGTKLGTGGLVRAYTEACQAVLAILPVEEAIEKIEIKIVIPYHLYEAAKAALLRFETDIIEEQFLTDVSIQGLLPLHFAESLEKEITELSAGRCTLEYPL